MNYRMSVHGCVCFVAGTISTNATVLYNPGQPTIHLVVTAHDHGTAQRSVVVAVRVQVIDVNNNAPTFLQSQYRSVSLLSMFSLSNEK